MVNGFTLKTAMASIPPVFDSEQIAIVASSGGYSNLVPMSDLTNLILLSALPFISNRSLWSTILNPIADAQWDEIEQWIDSATGELMTNIAIGSIFYSVALLTDPNVKLPIGQLLLQTDFPELTTVVPSSWLVGADIQLPDLRDTFMIGTPSGAQVGLPTGANTHVLTIGELAIHTHIQNPHSHTTIIPLVSPSGAVPIPPTPNVVIGTPAITGLANATNQSTGSDEPHNNIPQSLQAYAYIVVK